MIEIVGFLEGKTPDHRGRILATLLQQTDYQAESTHDYIQWLFPIPEAGRFNSFAPLLGEVARAAFAENEMLRANQRRSLDTMLAFFGLTRRELVIEALPDPKRGYRDDLKRFKKRLTHREGGRCRVGVLTKSLQSEAV